MLLRFSSTQSCESFAEDEDFEFDPDILELDRNASTMSILDDAPPLERNDTRIPPVVEGQPQILVGRTESVSMLERTMSSTSSRVHVEVVKEFRKGQGFGTSSFGTSWGALLKITDRPQAGPVIGRPSDVDVNNVRWRQWIQNAGFFAFLRAIGVIRHGQKVPNTASELQEQCGIVPVKDDSFCGFWCLAHIQGCGLSDVFNFLLEELKEDRFLAAQAREQNLAPAKDARLWEKVWAIAHYGCQRMSMARDASRDWDAPLLSEEEGLGQFGHAGTFVSRKLREDFSIYEIMLTPEELNAVSARLGLNTSVITVAPADVFFGEGYAQNMLLVAGQKISNVEDESGDEKLDKMGHELRDQGYRLVVADNARSEADSMDLADLKFPVITLLGGHFFVIKK